MKGVFISYRRADGGFVADDLAESLGQKIDRPIFYDIESISPGDDYRELIKKAISDSSVVVVLLGKYWDGKTDQERRIDDNEDIFRMEIEYSLELGIKVIPVLIGISNISPEELGPVSGLGDLHWHQIRFGQKWRDVDLLVQVVKDAIVSERQELIAGDSGFVRLENEYAGTFCPEKTWVDGTSSFQFSDELILRVNIALHSSRFLLVTGNNVPGAEMGQAIASGLGWRYLRETVDADTTADDLRYRYDSVGHLHAAQTSANNVSPEDFVSPGVLFKAFCNRTRLFDGRDPGGSVNAVVVLERIDQMSDAAIRSLMNTLTEKRFQIAEADHPVECEGRVFVIFVAQTPKGVIDSLTRKAVHYEIPGLTAETLRNIAEGATPDIPDTTVEAVIASLADGDFPSRLQRLTVSDFTALLICVHSMNITPGSTSWRVLLDSFKLLEV